MPLFVDMENELLYKIIDQFFLWFHSILSLFNLLGWIGKSTRKINLLTLGLTAASWFLLGIFYGMGYCFLTDWHWEVLRKLGHTDLPSSYIQYLLIRIFNWKLEADLVNTVTIVLFFIAIAASVYMNFIHTRLVKKDGKIK
jgi:hypothetical protein